MKRLIEKYRNAIISAIPAAICIAIVSILSVVAVAVLPDAVEQMAEHGRAVVAASVE